MNWNAIGAMAELVGAAGVVITLIYLALQVRQNTRALRAATFQSVIGFATGFAESVARDGEVARILQAGMADFESLDRVDGLRCHFQFIALLRRFENIHYQGRIGLLEEGQWEGLRSSLDHMMLQPGSRAWWRGNASLFNPGFREFMERRYAAADALAGRGMEPRVSHPRAGESSGD